jgi:hypothetical protein
MLLSADHDRLVFAILIVDVRPCGHADRRRSQYGAKAWKAGGWAKLATGGVKAFDVARDHVTSMLTASPTLVLKRGRVNSAESD